MNPSERITELELSCYVDDQLDAARRLEVADYLAHQPLVAARVMADLRIRDALRLARRSAPTMEAPRLREAALRLERGLHRAHLAACLDRQASAAATLAIRWFAGHLPLAAPGGREPPPAHPPYVADAVRSHQTVLLRVTMRTQRRAFEYDRADILRATDIPMPRLPEQWRPLDVQVFPSSAGPSVEVAMDVAEIGVLSLFAVEAGDGIAASGTARLGTTSVAHWRRARHAYALVGSVAEPEIARAAETLATRFD